MDTKFNLNDVVWIIGYDNVVDNSSTSLYDSDLRSKSKTLKIHYMKGPLKISGIKITSDGKGNNVIKYDTILGIFSESNCFKNKDEAFNYLNMLSDTIDVNKIIDESKKVKPSKKSEEIKVKI